MHRQRWLRKLPFPHDDYIHISNVGRDVRWVFAHIRVMMLKIKNNLITYRLFFEHHEFAIFVVFHYTVNFEYISSVHSYRLFATYRSSIHTRARTYQSIKANQNRNHNVCSVNPQPHSKKSKKHTKMFSHTAIKYCIRRLSQPHILSTKRSSDDFVHFNLSKPHDVFPKITPFIFCLCMKFF
jgi:hypothetical protein